MRQGGLKAGSGGNYNRIRITAVLTGIIIRVVIPLERAVLIGTVIGIIPGTHRIEIEGAAENGILRYDIELGRARSTVLCRDVNIVKIQLRYVFRSGKRTRSNHQRRIEGHLRRLNDVQFIGNDNLMTSGKDNFPGGINCHTSIITRYTFFSIERIGILVV